MCLCFVEFVFGLDTADEVLAHDFTEVGTPKSPSAVCDRGQRSVRATQSLKPHNQMPTAFYQLSPHTDPQLQLREGREVCIRMIMDGQKACAISLS